MIVKLLTEHHLEFLSLTGSCRGSSKPTHAKMPYCWKSSVTAHMAFCVGTHKIWQKIRFKTQYLSIVI